MKDLIVGMLITLMLLVSSPSFGEELNTCERYKIALELLEHKIETTIDRDLSSFYKSLYREHYREYFNKCLINDKCK